ncbi:MAG: glycosyltransferase family 2 protein [Cyclobacteriaceae bacterium]
MKLTAVVILNYNGQELLRKFLPSVVQHSADAEIFVADNCSTDNSREILAVEFPQVKLIEIPSNLGFCGGYNYALSKVEAKYYVLLNSDVEVTKAWLPPLISLLEVEASVAAVQPKILSYRDKGKFEYAGAGGGFIDKYGYPFCRGRLFHSLEDDTHQFDDTIPVFWASGACMAIRAELYHQLGGLDESFFAHMEEIDLCWRLNRMQKRVMYCGESTIYHIGGATLAASNPRKTYYNFRNGLMLLIKNYKPKHLMTRLPVRIALDWIASFKFLLSGQARDSWAVVKAHFYVLIQIRRIWERRKRTSSEVKSYSVSRVYEHSIVVDYFMKGKERFEDLEF